MTFLTIYFIIAFTILIIGMYPNFKWGLRVKTRHFTGDDFLALALFSLCWFPILMLFGFYCVVWAMIETFKDSEDGHRN